MISGGRAVKRNYHCNLVYDVNMKYHEPGGVFMGCFANTAIILAAGQGVRMRPFTDNFPKCMVPINGTTIIENALRLLCSSGVKKIVLVCGYKADVLIDYCNSLNMSLGFDFRLNGLYEQTNSMYSLKIALESVKEDCWVLEGDVFFQGDIFSSGETCTSPIFWLGDSSYDKSGGSFLNLTHEGLLEEVSILKSQSEIKPGMLKSVGILGLRYAAVPVVLKWLNDAVREKKSNLYYDLIFAEHSMEFPIKVYDVSSSKWAEIDTLQELKEAEMLFKP